MPSVPINMPGPVVTKAAAALRRVHTDLADMPDDEVVGEAYVRFVRGVVQAAEMERAENDIQAQVRKAREDAVQAISADVSQIRRG